VKKIVKGERKGSKAGDRAHHGGLSRQKGSTAAASFKGKEKTRKKKKNPTNLKESSEKESVVEGSEFSLRFFFGHCTSQHKGGGRREEKKLESWREEKQSTLGRRPVGDDCRLK